jgi:F-type H+-transporting ATPase subunit delta
VIDRDRRGASLKRIFENRVTDLTLRFLLVLNDKGRLSRLESVVGAFDTLVQEAFGRVEVDVFTAAPLGREQVDDIRRRIHAALNREPVLHPYTDTSMIGGLKLRIGDQLIDGSVATQLRRMRSELQQSTGKLRDRASRFISD